MNTIDPPEGLAQHCSFCKASRMQRDYMLFNEPRDTVICDVCVTVLHEKVQNLRILETVDAGPRAH